jgi:hypothetical protein
LRHPPSRIAKEHALDLAVDDDPLADHVRTAARTALRAYSSS